MTAVNLNRAIRGPVTAVPVVAGKGVRLVADTVNNRFVAEADETVLYIDPNWSGVTSCTLSEAPTNFEYIDITVGFYGATNGTVVQRFPGTCIALHFLYGAGQGATDYFIRSYGSVSGTSISVSKAKCMYSSYSVTTADTIRNNAENDMKCIYKVVGVNRIASN